MIYDGSFSGRLTEGDGVTAELLKANGIAAFQDTELDALLATSENDDERGTAR